MNWEGYYNESPYIKAAHKELLPTNIDLAGVCIGTQFRENNSSFSYCDLGCGFALTTILAAALHPEAVFVGIDINPDHVEYNKRFADKLGLSNCFFYCAPFDECVSIIQDHGPYDYVVAHGVYSWVSEKVRDQLIHVTSLLVTDHGCVVTTYNAQPGWLARQSYKKLFDLYASTESKQDAVEQSKNQYSKIHQNSPVFNQFFPREASLFKTHYEQTTDYLLHEYANEGWSPQYSSDVIAMFENQGLIFSGSLNVEENFTGRLPPSMQSLVDDDSERKRQLNLDISTCATFRRDIFQKKPKWLDRSEQVSLLNKISYRRNANSKIAPNQKFGYFNMTVELSELFKQIVHQAPQQQEFSISFETGADKTLFIDLAVLMKAGFLAQALTVEQSKNVRAYNLHLATECLGGSLHKGYIESHTAIPVAFSPIAIYALASMLVNPNGSDEERISTMLMNSRRLFPGVKKTELTKALKANLKNGSSLMRSLTELGL